MTDEEIMTNESEEYIPESVTESEPASAPEPEPTPELGPSPEPETPAAPVEVITVEDLLDRITGESSSEAPPQEEGDETSKEEMLDTLPEVEGEQPVEVIGMDQLLKQTGTLLEVVDHPLMTTPFEDYTVTEGLLLLLLLSVFLAACVKLLKGGFSWLR